MARIPVSPGPSLVQANRPAIREDARAFFPAVESGRIGRSLVRAGGVLGEFAVAREEAGRRVQLADLEIEAGSRLRALHGELDRSAGWQDQEEAFATGANELRDTLLARVSDARVKDAFTQSYARQLAGIAPEVTASAFRKQKDEAVAVLEQQLPELANAAAAAPTGVAREQAIGQAVGSIKARFAGGFLSAREAGDQIRKLRGQVDEADVRTLIAGAPDLAVAALSDATRFPNIDPARRATFLDSALRRDEANRAEAVRLAEKREREAETARQRRADELMKGILGAKADGVLTRDYIEAARKDLSSSDYRTALMLLEDKGAKHDDPATVIRLRDLVDGGDMAGARAEADTAFRGGLIDEATHRDIRLAASARPQGSAPPPAYTMARDYVRRYLDLPPDISTMESGALLAEAVAEVDRFFLKNPAATVDEADSFARDVVRRAIPPALRQAVDRMPLEPVGYAGIRAEEGDGAEALAAKLQRIDAMEQQIEDDLAGGRIGEGEAARLAASALRFRQLAETMQRTLPALAPKGKPK